MRTQFFLYLLVALIACAVGYFIWLVLRSIFDTAVDLKTGRELDRLAGQLRNQRSERERDALTRLDNGCEHEFHEDGGAFPPDVCRRCGIARHRPAGDCDHQWQRQSGIIPHSRCAKCGEEYSSVSRV